MNSPFRRTIVLSVLLLVSATAFAPQRSPSSPGEPALSPWLVGSAPPPIALLDLATAKAIPLNTLRPRRPTIIVLASPTCAPTTKLLGELAEAAVSLGLHADMAVIWRPGEADTELPTETLPNATHYRLMEDRKGFLIPTVWVLNAEGQIIFDHRGYTSGLPALLGAVVGGTAP